MPWRKNLIEAADHQDALPVWTEDEAGPDQTVPDPGSHWHPAGEPVRSPHEHIRAGRAKPLTLFHPASGQARVKSVRQSPNAVLPPWLTAELEAILAALPTPTPIRDHAENRREWERWQAGRTIRITLPEELPPLRMLRVWDDLAGHLTPALVLWLFAHGIMPLDTPLGGSWLNMAESIQRGPEGILTRRALAGEHPQSSEEIIAWREATARGWNRDPTPFVWHGKRHARRHRARERRHRLAGSGACTTRPLSGARTR